jgi:hypothetical protein
MKFRLRNYKINWNEKCFAHILADIISGLLTKVL